MSKSTRPFIPGCCRPVLLPEELWVPAAQTAVEKNPANGVPRELAVKAASQMIALVGGAKGKLAAAEMLKPQHLALKTSKYWGPVAKLGVKFLDRPSPALRRKILVYANAWNRRGANVKFVESADGPIRLARIPGQGYFSYLGPDCFHVPAGQQTMNLDSFTLFTPDSEFARVVPHEFGHALGFVHEHLLADLVSQLDRAATIAYFMRVYNWTAFETTVQVLTPEDNATLRRSGPADQGSVMCYQIPGECTLNHQPILGGGFIDETDYATVAKFYPPAGRKRAA